MHPDDIEALAFAKQDGLLPAIVQHAGSGQVLMLGYMNREALDRTLETGKVTFYSRSRECLWTKGETSSHVLDLVRIESDCDHDTLHAVEVCGAQARLVWHKDDDLKGVDAVILPGGFSYGDYLRCGAMARFSPIMADVKRFADAGGPVLGICNGFQILCEAGLLPGALLRNRGLAFVCDFVHVRVERADTLL